MPTMISKAKKNKLLLIISMIIIFSLASCETSSSSTAKKDDADQPTMNAHSIPVKEEKRLMKDVKEDIKLINEARDDTSTLSKALSGNLLKNTISQIATDSANNVIRVRKYSSPKFKLKNYTKGIAGITMTFIDKGYFIDKKTKKKTDPKKNKTTLILVLKKEKGRWKIIEIFSPEVKVK